MSYLSALKIVREMNDNDLEDLICAIKDRRNQLAKERITDFFVGESVFFINDGLKWFGEILKINRTKVVVRIDEKNFKDVNKRYIVPVNMLRKMTP